MKGLALRLLGFLTMFLFIGAPAYAQGLAEVPQAELDSAGFFYKLVKSSFVAVDEVLLKAGAPVVFCSYIDTERKINFLAREAGACLYKNLTDGLSKDGPLGQLEIWVRTSSGQVLPLQIQWRPTEQGYWGVVREFLSWKFEYLPHWWSEKFEDDPQAEKVWTLEQSVLGHITLKLPKTFAQIFTGTQLPQIDQAKSLSLSMRPLFRKNGYLNYEISMAAQIQDETSVGMNLKTNANVIRLERSFFLKGRLAQEEGGQ